MFVDTCRIDQSLLGRRVDREEMRRVQLEMLDALAEYCGRYGLAYYLSGGTLLGAVRHKGYIPWDDDIDINMPRPDCDRLIRMTGGRLNDHVVIASPDGPIRHGTSFPRLCDTRYILHSSSPDGKSSYYTNLFVDIFPIEGLPTEWEKVKRHYVIAKSLVVMRKLAYFRGIPISPMFNAATVLRHIAHPFAKLTGYRLWNRLLLKHAKKYKYDECPYVGVVTSCEHTLEEYIEREGYGTPIQVEFEGKRYNAPADTDKYLKNLYGDYMQLPPPEKRVAHNFEVYESRDPA